MVPFEKLPGTLKAVSELLPAAALSIHAGRHNDGDFKRF